MGCFDTTIAGQRRTRLRRLRLQMTTPTRATYAPSPLNIDWAASRYNENTLRAVRSNSWTLRAQQLVPRHCPRATSGLDIARSLVDKPEEKHYRFVLSFDFSGNLKIQELVILRVLGQSGELAFFFVPDRLEV